MAEYVSPFAKSGTSGGGSKKPGKERYISPFEGSIYNDDYWDKQDQQRQVADQQRQADEQKRQQEEAARKAEEERKKRAERPFWEKGLEAVGKAFSPEGLAKAGTDVKEVLVDAPVNTAVNAYKQAAIGTEAIDGPGINKKLYDSENKAIEDALKSGSISEDEAKQRRERLQSKVNTQTTNVKKAEEKYGTKYDPNQGALDALETLTMIDLPFALAKGGAKVGKSLVDKFARQKGDDVAETVLTKAPEPTSTLPVAADSTTPTQVTSKPTTLLDKVASTKPAEYFFGDKQRVIDAQVRKANRAELYTPEPTKPRLDPGEAQIKLTEAGYTPDEATKILEDALPDKGLSMPGSPKRLGLSDESIKQAAINFDETTAPKAPETTNIKPLASLNEDPELGTSKLALSVQDKAVQNKLISKTEAETSELPTYNKANMKEQAEYATRLIKDDPQTAVDIAMGRRNAPDHVLPQMVYNAVEEHAIKIGGEKGGKLLKELAGSKQVSDLTVMAQNVRAAAERNPHSPVTLINDLKLSRMEAAKKRGKNISKVEKEDARIIKQATPKVKKETWESFVEELTC